MSSHVAGSMEEHPPPTAAAAAVTEVAVPGSTRGMSKGEQRRLRKQDKRETAMRREILSRLSAPEDVVFAKGGPTNGGRHVFAMPSHRIYADTLPRMTKWLNSLFGRFGGAEPVLFDGWPFAVVSFADAASAAAAVSATNRTACSVEGDKRTGGGTDRRMLLVVQG